MIRAILFAAAGFWLSRKLYQTYDLKKRKELLKEIEQRTRELLADDGWTKQEIELAIDDILEDYE